MCRASVLVLSRPPTHDGDVLPDSSHYNERQDQVRSAATPQLDTPMTRSTQHTRDSIVQRKTHKGIVLFWQAMRAAAAWVWVCGLGLWQCQSILTFKPSSKILASPSPSPPVSADYRSRSAELQVALGIRQLEYTRPVTTYTSRPSGTGTYEKQCIDVIQLRHAHTPESTGSWNAVSVDCDCSLPLVDYHRIGYELDAKKIMTARLLAMHGQLRPNRVAVMSKPYIICWAVSA